MYIRLLLATMMIALSLSAGADFRTVSRAYEVPLNLFTVPVTHNGQIVIKECGDCKAVSARLTSETQYKINGKTVTLSDFRTEAFRVRDRDRTYLTVLHHLETDTITLIAMSL